MKKNINPGTAPAMLWRNFGSCLEAGSLFDQILRK